MKKGNMFVIQACFNRKAMFNLFVINDFYPFKQQHNEIYSSNLPEEKYKEIISQSLVILKLKKSNSRLINEYNINEVEKDIDLLK